MTSPINRGSERIHSNTPTRPLPGNINQATIAPDRELLQQQSQNVNILLGALVLSRNRAEIEGYRTRLANSLRRYSRSQATLWQQIPYWDLMAQGIAGYQDDTAYTRGVWPISRMRSDGWCEAGVRCNDGEIVHIMRPALSLPDEQVINIATQELNAGQILYALINHALQPLPNHASKSPEELTKWRAEQLRKHNVQLPK